MIDAKRLQSEPDGVPHRVMEHTKTGIEPPETRQKEPPPEPEAEAQVDDGEEIRPGLGPRHQAVAAVLTKLATTARSFLFYDARNEAIHHFLTALLEGFVQTLSEEHQLVLSVQPFEMWFEGEPVYLNRDRDKSLAFRLYRDGVRALKFQNGFHWDELARLLEILSIRYTGVHQNEDDIVTLLWKANFKHLDIVAVEGFVPEDEDPASDAMSPAAFAFADDLSSKTSAKTSGETDVHTSGAIDTPPLPDNVDLPRPFLPTPAAPEWLPVSEESLEALRNEVAASALPRECMALLRRLRLMLEDPQDPLRFSDVAHLFGEVRDFLLSDEHLEPLVQFLELLTEMAAEDPSNADPGRSAAIRELLNSVGDHRAVHRLLHSVPVEERRLKPELAQVLTMACPDPIDAILESLATERGTAAHAIGRQLLEHFGNGQLELLEKKFATVGGALATDMLRVIAHVGGEEAAPFVALQCSHPEPDVQDEALRHLERVTYSGAIGKAMFDAFRRAGGARRTRLLHLMAQSGDKRFVELLTRFIDDHPSEIDGQDAIEIGRTLGRLGGAAALSQWHGWLKPTGLFRKSLPGSSARQIAAAAAISELPGDEPAQILRAALVIAGAESHDWIGRSLAHQRNAKRAAN